MTTTAAPARLVQSTLSTLSWIRLCPILQDNYSYVLVCPKTNQIALVDPAEPERVLRALSLQQINVTDFGAKQLDLAPNMIQCVLTTHKHWDHAGGNEQIKKLYPHVEIVGSALEDIPAVTKRVSHNDEFVIGSSLHVRVLCTPCHTRGHVQYLVTRVDSETGARVPGPRALFSGDTLFVGGCGRFFEGTAENMLHNMKTLSAELDPDTEVYCGHEYTVKNLQFALDKVEPENAVLAQKLQQAKELRASGLPTIPSTIGEELAYNPFMRCHEPSVQRSARRALGLEDGAPLDEVATMKQIRAMKDAY